MRNRKKKTRRLIKTTTGKRGFKLVNDNSGMSYIKSPFDMLPMMIKLMERLHKNSEKIISERDSCFGASLDNHTHSGTWLRLPPPGGYQGMAEDLSQLNLQDFSIDEAAFLLAAILGNQVSTLLELRSLIASKRCTRIQFCILGEISADKVQTLYEQLKQQHDCCSDRK